MIGADEPTPAPTKSMRWAGLQWSCTYPDEDPRIEIDPDFGALHEVRGSWNSPVTDDL
ncbi:hypothetical protein GCM10017786_28660 [Amycolatopsis deserti]|uniref:Uncharacterized protein n=1 Tax=Amycolatopsis deserti TaxID=185696 RepID=A0ABQ3IVH9_9PSEU|nr:hypothetical protein GCM10017786_28660 [Amycolatopsis deserti]